MNDDTKALCARLRTEADLCHNETADDVAALLDEAADCITALEVENAALEKCYADAISDCEIARGQLDLHVGLSESLKLALRMPGTGSYVEWAKECRAAVVERDDLRAKLEATAQALENVQHGHVCPAQSGWLDAGPCTCGLDAALTAMSGAAPGHKPVTSLASLDWPAP